MLMLSKISGTGHANDLYRTWWMHNATQLYLLRIAVSEVTVQMNHDTTREVCLLFHPSPHLKTKTILVLYHASRCVAPLLLIDH